MGHEGTAGNTSPSHTQRRKRAVPPIEDERFAVAVLGETGQLTLFPLMQGDVSSVTGTVVRMRAVRFVTERRIGHRRGGTPHLGRIGGI